MKTRIKQNKVKQKKKWTQVRERWTNKAVFSGGLREDEKRMNKREGLAGARWWQCSLLQLDCRTLLLGMFQRVGMTIKSCEILKRDTPTRIQFQRLTMKRRRKREKRNILTPKHREKRPRKNNKSESERDRKTTKNSHRTMNF